MSKDRSKRERGRDLEMQSVFSSQSLWGILRMPMDGHALLELFLGLDNPVS